jgi:protocatechuate 4,5-dioxygenase alpha subunit
MFCMSLMKEENRQDFKANEAEYLKKFQLTNEQRDAILKRDYNRMLSSVATSISQQSSVPPTVIPFNIWQL